ncbi:MAG: ribonuclease Y [Candidatus Pacebacteria bacterium]|nr:ribonuclease Y [Candidatus Paceibacterota bacterium]MDD3072567.1 ribonuclease Y [Candidatus Paceibacterota bacterium]MDD3729096.1 ribonuclease Y [Candidatus Paceibacterota bacterium]MDD4201603.1 ribonuclease Y [Candidatus Paceibacterota bacterium]MDD4467101.1 ribonuclease Y [Candidatus Paceibacterota bacterium]
MNQLILLVAVFLALTAGSIFGYFARQSIARKRADKIETTLKKRISEVKKETEELLLKAQEKSSAILEEAARETEEQKKEIFKAERLLLKRENLLGEKITDIENREKEFNKKVEKLKEIKANLENLHLEASSNLERISSLSKEEAKKELLEITEKEYEKDLLLRLRKLEEEGEERMEKRAKEILTMVIQRCAMSHAQEITTTTVSIPSDEIKGRIIGKEGRNINTLEKLTGVEIIVDDTPEAVTISGFDPIRRQIAKNALEKLVKDGRIQPARIEEMVKKAEEEIASQVKEAGEKAIYDTGIMGLNPRLVNLVGRLRFRTSYGQNALLHSIEVSHLAAGLASEVGGNVKVAQKAGLLHDIGKAIDHQVKGTHVDIGIKILEKFGVEKEVIDAMKSHHEEYPTESLEGILVQTADQISGARPGARKDTLENYLKRLEDLEQIASDVPGIERAYAIQAGRELRIFVRPNEISDFAAKKMAKEIAEKIQEELKYPGEIKVTVIRENRAVEYAR